MPTIVWALTTSIQQINQIFTHRPSDEKQPEHAWKKEFFNDLIVIRVSHQVTLNFSPSPLLFYSNLVQIIFQEECEP